MNKEEILESDIIGFLRITNDLSMDDTLELRKGNDVKINLSLETIKNLVKHCKK